MPARDELVESADIKTIKQKCPSGTTGILLESSVDDDLDATSG
jgi:hypothetical protein